MSSQAAQGGISSNDQSKTRRAMQAYLASKHPKGQISMDIIYENLQTVKGTGVRAQQVDAILMGACRLTTEEVDRMCDLMTGGATAEAAYVAVKNGSRNGGATSASGHGNVTVVNLASTGGPKTGGGQSNAPRNNNSNTKTGSAGTGGPRNGGGQSKAPQNKTDANTGSASTTGPRSGGGQLTAAPKQKNPNANSGQSVQAGSRQGGPGNYTQGNYMVYAPGAYIYHSGGPP